MIFPGKTERRLAVVILVTTTVPLAVALYLATSLFRQASALWFNPEIGVELDRGVEMYKEYARATKEGMKEQTVLLSADEELRRAAQAGDRAKIADRLERLFSRGSDLVSLAVVKDDETLAQKNRGHPVDESTERRLEVRKPLSDREDGALLVAEFATPRKQLDELEKSGLIVNRYHQVESSRSDLYSGYLNAFGALLGIMVIVTVGLGVVLARGITKRIRRLVRAITLVARGDLSIRVPVTGSDELTELASNFNRMLVEVQTSRTRIEYLERMSTWQEMAQRLAHEIKNPLTPIQLAVEECHRKFDGPEGTYKRLLDSTLEIVEEEVGTLRRLVSNFSNFARLPNAELEAENLGEFLRECKDTLGHLEDPTLGEGSPDATPLSGENVVIDWVVPDVPIVVALDRQMFRRVLVNLVRNAVQAIGDASPRKGRVIVRAEPRPTGAVIYVEDNGPGISADLRRRVFDPYVTTKKDGTGLGLAIVKKIVVEHGGEIEVTESDLGGARFAISLSGPEILEAARLAKEAKELAVQAGVETAA
jgi:nitrogen fixation/metabolism regulation signal transduction histidine kinase